MLIVFGTKISSTEKLGEVVSIVICRIVKCSPGNYMDGDQLYFRVKPKVAHGPTKLFLHLYLRNQK